MLSRARVTVGTVCCHGCVKLLGQCVVTGAWRCWDSVLSRARGQVLAHSFPLIANTIYIMKQEEGG